MEELKEIPSPFLPSSSSTAGRRKRKMTLWVKHYDPCPFFRSLVSKPCDFIVPSSLSPESFSSKSTFFGFFFLLGSIRSRLSSSIASVCSPSIFSSWFGQARSETQHVKVIGKPIKISRSKKLKVMQNQQMFNQWLTFNPSSISFSNTFLGFFFFFFWLKKFRSFKSSDGSGKKEKKKNPPRAHNSTQHSCELIPHLK